MTVPTAPLLRQNFIFIIKLFSGTALPSRRDTAVKLPVRRIGLLLLTILVMAAFTDTFLVIMLTGTPCLF